MPEFREDPATREARIIFRRGAQVARTATVNGNTAGYDANGVMIYYHIANPFTASGIMLDGLPEHDACREMLKFYGIHRTTG